MNHCRICAQTDKQPLIKILEDNPLKIHEKLQKLLRIKLSPHSKLPEKICLECLTKLNQYNEFYTTAIENQVILEIIYGEKSETVQESHPLAEIAKPEESEQFFIIEELPEDTQTSAPEISLEAGEESDEAEADVKFIATPSCAEKKRKFDRFDCYLCKEQLPGNLRFIKHFEEKHPKQEIQYTCHICSARVRKYRSFTRHVDSHSAKRFACDVCEKDFSQKITLVQHLKTHSNIKSYKCTDCGLNFKQNSSLFKHRKQKHSSQASPTCDLCQKTFVNSETLQQHLRSKHTAEKTINCSDCDKLFASRSALLYHRASQHPSSSRANLRCSTCNKTFKTAVILQRHLKNVH